jgi:hypothetical protein
MVGVPNDWTAGGWNLNTVPASSFLLDMNNGNMQNFAVHGLLYAPNQAVRLTATNLVIADALGGVVSSTLELQSSASAQGKPVVSIPSVAPTPRLVVITGCAPALPDGSCTVVAGEKPVKSTAVVQVGNDAAKTVSIKSWRTPGPSDP